MHPLLQSWDGLIHDVARRPSLVISGVRKIVQGVMWETPGEAWTGDEPFSWQDISYSGKDNKINQLTRIYYNQAFVDEGRAKLRTRVDDEATQTSVGIVMRGDDKDSRSQGHCIQNIVVTHAEIRGKEIVTVDVFYRSTECIKKFLADVIFLRKVVFPGILEGFPWPQTIRFYFSNIFLSALFVPIHLRYSEDKLALFETLRETDPRFFRTCLNACSKFFEASHNYSYRERIRMFDYTQQFLTKNEITELRSYCRSYKS